MTSTRASRLQTGVFVLVCAVTLVIVASAQPRIRPITVSVIGFGETGAGKRVTQQLQLVGGPSNSTEFLITDPDQARAAAAGTGYNGSLNLTLEEARNIGAAIGCDFFFTGEAQTLQRSPSTGPSYFESYASIFLVSARSGKLVFWERQEFRRPTAIQAEQALLTSLAAASTGNRYQSTIRRAAEEERETRARAIEAATPVIDVMSDDEASSGLRAPRPFRRIKPPYPDAAAHDQVEATIDALADIDEKGKVRHVEIARWAGYGLDESVVNTIKQMDFFPAMRDGRAIPMRVLLRYNFRKPQ